MARPVYLNGWFWVGVGTLALMFPALAFYLLEAPFGRDQGIFLWQAEVIRAGGLPYVDAWDHKGPLVPLLYALAGGTHTGVRLLDLTFFVMTLGALALCWPDRLAGILSATLFFCFLAPNWWTSGQPDLWASAWLIWVLILTRHPGRTTALLAGGLLGLMVLIKPVYLLPAAVIGVWFFSAAWPRREVGGSLRLTLFVLGGLLPGIAMLAWLAQGGALSPMLDAVVTFNITGHLLDGHFGLGILPPLSQWLAAKGPTTPLAHALFGLLLLAALAHAWRRGERLLPFVWLAAWLTMICQNKGISYHYFPHMAVMALLWGTAGADLCRRLNVHNGSGFKATLLAGILIISVSRVVLAPRDYVSPGDGFSAPALQEAADVVAQQLSPDETLYLWGYDAGIFPLSQRRSVSRYGHNHALLLGDYAARRAEVMDTLTRTPPQGILVQRGEHNGPNWQDSETLLKSFPALETLIRTDYREHWRNDNFILYLRNHRPAR